MNTRTDAPHNDENERRDYVATRIYNERYDNNLYREATRGQSNEYANELIDAALALCGCPYFYSTRDWNRAAYNFLVKFVTIDDNTRIVQGWKCRGSQRIIKHVTTLREAENYGAVYTNAIRRGAVHVEIEFSNCNNEGTQYADVDVRTPRERTLNFYLR